MVELEGGQMKGRNVNRRQFLKNSALGLVGAGIVGRMAAETLEANKEKNQNAGPAFELFVKIQRDSITLVTLNNNS